VLFVSRMSIFFASVADRGDPSGEASDAKEDDDSILRANGALVISLLMSVCESHSLFVSLMSVLSADGFLLKSENPSICVKEVEVKLE
jgi:hypothetical protein